MLIRSPVPAIRHPRPLPVRLLLLFCLLAGFGLLGATGLSAFARSHWSLDLLTHLRPHASLAAMALLLVAAAFRHAPTIAVASLALVLNGAPILPDVVGAMRAAPTGEAAPHGPHGSVGSLKLLLANVLTANPDPSRLDRLIAREAPDVIALLEVDERWLGALEHLRARYRYRLTDPRSDNFGIALLSRFPLHEARLAPLGSTGPNAIVAGVSLGGRDVDILLAHPLPPVGSVYSAIRNTQLLELGRLRERSDASEFVLLGDLNTTPWSPFFRDLRDATGLRLAARDHGYAPTWPSTLAPWLRIPIDHALLSPGLRARTYRVGPEIGSDHLPVLLEVALAPGPSGLESADRASHGGPSR